MDLSIKWNNNNYQEFLNCLKKCQDIKYRDFHKKILNDDESKLIGIRTPELRKMAKEIKDIDGFLKYNTHQFYEENILAALVITKVKENLLEYIDNFIPYINNWAVCDIFAGSLKQFKNIDIKVVKKYLNSNNPWSVRFGLVLLLSHYVSDKYIDEILKICDSINIDHYYVKMANAWALSICYIKFPEKTEKFLKTTKIDTFTYNKTISKICDSYRVSKEDKNRLKEMKKGGIYNGKNNINR